LSKPQQQVVTGVPSYGDMKELTIGFLLKLPFTTIRPWKKYPALDQVNPNQLRIDQKSLLHTADQPLRGDNPFFLAGGTFRFFS